MKTEFKFDVLIAGCGYIGKKTAQLFLEQEITFSTLVNSSKSQTLCEKLGFPVSLIDLDIPLAKDEIVSAKTILYLISPQAKGQQDLRLKAFLKHIKKTPKNFILISTTGVYGDCKGAWINEESLTHAQADRAKRRLDAERQATDYCQQYNINLIILRVAGIYAADKLPIKRLLSNEAILCEEDSGFSNRIHAEDLANICMQSCLKNTFTGIYNCTDGQPSSMCDYFKRVALACQLNPPQEINMHQAQQQLSAAMLSYLIESKRIENKKLLAALSQNLQYPNLESGLKNIKPIK